MYGEWVVISGATDGIGLEYAKEFARRGHSVILLGRSESKLSQAKQQVTRYTSPSKVVTIQVDFDEADSQVRLSLGCERFSFLLSSICTARGYFLSLTVILMR